MNIDPTALSPVSALAGALMGGGASLVAAIYTQRFQNRLQRIAAEVSKREAVYADFVMNASHLLLSAHIRDDIALGGEEQHLVGLINRMRLFAPKEVLDSAEAVLRGIVNVMLRPRVELRQLAIEALTEGSRPDPVQPFSLVCREDLDNVRKSRA